MLYIYTRIAYCIASGRGSPSVRHLTEVESDRFRVCVTSDWDRFLIPITIHLFQVAQVPMSQDQTPPIQIGDGQPTLCFDKHSVRGGRRSRHCAVVPVAPDHATDHVAARERRHHYYFRRHSHRRNRCVQENAVHAQVPRLVSRPRMSGRHGQILNPSSGSFRSDDVV